MVCSDVCSVYHQLEYMLENVIIKLAFKIGFNHCCTCYNQEKKKKEMRNTSADEFYKGNFIHPKIRILV